MNWFTRHLLGPLIAVGLLSGLYATDAMHTRPSDVGDYHERVAAAVEAVPYVVGDWIGHDVPVPTQATDMLKPNAMLSRQYLNTRTGQRVSVMLIHTLDARDLIGHYPPECYPASGWTITGRDAVMLPTEDQAPDEAEKVEVAQYRFAMDDFANRKRLQVLNLMILPTGRYTIGMAGLSGVSGDYRIRHFGAAAMQMVFTEEVSRSQQEALWAIFFEQLRPAIETIQNARNGQTPDP